MKALRKISGLFYFCQSKEGTMKLKQISVPIENSNNRLYEFTRALDEKGITPRAIQTLKNKDGNYEKPKTCGA